MTEKYQASKELFDKNIRQLQQEAALCALEKLQADEKLVALSTYIKSLSPEQQEQLKKTLN